MFMPTPDYNQQLLAYLQTWRQLLEQWAAMGAALPFPTGPSVMPGAPAGGQFMPPPMPFPPPTVPFMQQMPPTAPVPPAPADYAQHLFSYLQAWRQYLEQMTCPRPGSPEPSTPQQAANAPQDERPTDGGGNGRPPGPPDGPTPPGDSGGGKRTSTSPASQGSNPPWPPLVNLPPGSYSLSQVAGGFDPAGAFVSEMQMPQVLSPPEYDFGYQFEGPRVKTFTAGPAVSTAGSEAAGHAAEAAAQFAANSPFQNAMQRVELGASPQLEQRSLFGSAAQAAEEVFRQPRETPSP